MEAWVALTVLGLVLGWGVLFLLAVAVWTAALISLYRYGQERNP